MGQAMAGEVRAIQRLYDRWAAFYDWNPILKVVQPARREAIEAMDLKAGDTVVDMATGTGANLGLLRDAVGPSGTVIGIDASEKMIERARIRVETQGWENVELLRADIRDPPVKRPIDGICSTFVAMMYDDPRTLIEPWSGLLAQGTMVNLYSGPSRRQYAPVVNGLLRVYLRVFGEGWSVGKDRTPLEILSQRGDRARTGLSDLAQRTSHDEFVLGLVHLDVGRF